MNEPKRFMRLPDVVALVGLKRTAIYGRIKKGTFPAPVQLGARGRLGRSGYSGVASRLKNRSEALWL